MRENAFFIVENVHGNCGVEDIKTKLEGLHGITAVSVDSKNHLIAAEYDSSGTSYDKIENTLNKMGFQIAADASEIHTR